MSTIVARRARCALFATYILTCSSSALAQDLAHCQSLFDEGLKLVRDGRYVEGSAMLEESQKLCPSILTQFYLADGLERAGRLIAALKNYLEVAEEAASAGDPGKERVARERAEALRVRIPRLAILVSSAAQSIQGLTIERDGVTVGKTDWGKDVPVDPGAHVITAEAPGWKRWEGKVEAIERQAASVSIPDLVHQGTLRIEVSEPASGQTIRRDGALVEQGQWGAEIPVGFGIHEITATAPGRLSWTAKIDVTPDRWAGGVRVPPLRESNSVSTQRILGVVAGGVGLVGVGIGTFFGVRGLNKISEMGRYCNDQNQCDSRGLELHDEAQHAATASTVALVAGGAAAAAGVALFLTAPSPEQATNARTGLVIGPTSLVLRATW